MTILLFRVATLTAIYLLVLTSVAPGDILVGIVLSLLLVAAGRRIRPLGPPIGVPMMRYSAAALTGTVSRSGTGNVARADASSP